MDRINSIKELVAQKQEALESNDNKAVIKANKSINISINDMVSRIKDNMERENDYKSYLEKNKELVRKQVGLNRQVETVEEAMELIKQVDFRYVFGLDVGLKEVFDCDLICNGKEISFVCKSKEEADRRVEEELYNNHGAEINEHGCYERFGMFVREIRINGERIKAWIEYDKKKRKYLYIVGSIDNEYYAITKLDIFNLFQIFFKCDIKTSFKELADLLNIRISEIEEIRNKYERNKKFLRENLKSDSFPVLRELVGKHINKLDILLEEAINKLYYHINYNKNNVFSASMDHLGEIMEKGKSTISPIINTFVLLGLVEKADVNTGVFNRGNNNDITHFYIPEYNQELFAKSEQLAKIMLYQGKRITASKFSYGHCIEKFGKETANKTFKDKVVKARAS
ncbi:hypothetical protein [Clostridium sp.]|uniref:hypothetical protein n=1 Tax=Clostridium sp. TaxID=1506 RepID=UPI002FC636F1